MQRSASSILMLALILAGLFSSLEELSLRAETSGSNRAFGSLASGYQNVTTHEGNLVITGTQTYRIENCTFIQTGNIYVENRAKLSINNAEIWMNQTGQSEFKVEDYAVMEVKDSNVRWDYGTLAYTFLHNSTALFDGLTNIGEYFYIDFLEYSKAFFHNFSFTGSPGDIRFQDYSVGYISNSKIPALSPSDISQLEILDTRIAIFELWFGYAGETVQVNGLKSGFFEYLDLKEKIVSSHHSFDVKLNRTSVNWWLDACSDSKTTISDSTIAMFGIVVREGVSASVEGLRPGFYESASSGQIELSRVLVTEFVRLICDGTCTISDSEFELIAWGKDWHVNILNSIVNWISVWGGVGSLCFDNTTWRGGGLDISFSNLYMSGNMSCGYVTSWFSSNITRNYNIEVRDNYHEPTISDASLNLKSRENVTVWNGTTDDQGRASFNLTLADGNYTETLRLEAVKGNWSSIASVTFVSTTPIVFFSPFPPPPVASFTYNPEKPIAQEQIVFNASESHSTRGNITILEWNFGDGNTMTVMERTINHTYVIPGNHTVTLKVWDNNTLWDTASRTITVLYRTDLNRDRAVNILDVSMVAAAYNTRPSDEKWNELADLDMNGQVNILDISAVAKDYGKTV